MGTQLVDGASHKAIPEIVARTSDIPPILLFDDAPIEELELNFKLEFRDRIS